MKRLALIAALCLGAAGTQAAHVCTLVADAHSGAVLFERGDCDSRVTPASTFKVPLALIGFQTGFLTDTQTPVLKPRKGDPDWGGDAWRQPTTPERWLKYSVVWYSQRITRALGAEVLRDLALAYGYGNADFSGDAGYDNGLERAWIASSLKVSPREQVTFLRGLVTDTLPAAPRAMALTRETVEARTVGAWWVKGKTGTAFPRRADRSFDRAAGWGWFVGWAQQGERVLVFATLTQATKRQDGSPGNLTRDAFLKGWLELAKTLPEG
ncbi:class D beta-lactamase [Sulfitobacter pseudonitzschiae]|uniref:Beta-lactamase n=1 Tax=Pseudosulfitobacter pseudonitzschiae TaxID=1402135 RepID=A0A9Q2NTB4_9RHOB|nr:class D beta-lactamase [Pseudosulfitobacter pseudonitzschiae]MBM2293966.1 class D beta-lactamase [Pseudosulfitobacter pseudonitzschiae]MBM2298887.1 class D beta-lactamase [Pseudosulfitobacter pseudonitzschiae]MBM2303801.1 class D beta-lactamase [Pseudosulfitobacter pseudonitzschiae]MBM2313580.1 class D beta-lactamase [Pseudosulfitobacter pseudonitzschiae]MBM2318498.1 class D beta-lactamase [Pseudosulfitobacter pseudonitzschiae]